MSIIYRKGQGGGFVPSPPKQTYGIPYKQTDYSLTDEEKKAAHSEATPDYDSMWWKVGDALHDAAMTPQVMLDPTLLFDNERYQREKANNSVGNILNTGAELGSWLLGGEMALAKAPAALNAIKKGSKAVKNAALDVVGEKVPLYRAQPKGFDINKSPLRVLEEKIAAGENVPWYHRNALNVPEQRAKLESLNKYYGRWFENNPKRLSYYIDDRAAGKVGDIEFLKIKVPKHRIGQYNVANYPDAAKLSLSPETEFILPKKLVKKANRLTIGDVPEVGYGSQAVQVPKSGLAGETSNVLIGPHKKITPRMLEATDEAYITKILDSNPHTGKSAVRAMDEVQGFSTTKAGQHRLRSEGLPEDLFTNTHLIEAPHGAGERGASTVKGANYSYVEMRPKFPENHAAQTVWHETGHIPQQAYYKNGNLYKRLTRQDDVLSKLPIKQQSPEWAAGVRKTPEQFNLSQLGDVMADTDRAIAYWGNPIEKSPIARELTSHLLDKKLITSPYRTDQISEQLLKDAWNRYMKYGKPQGEYQRIFDILDTSNPEAFKTLAKGLNVGLSKGGKL